MKIADLKPSITDLTQEEAFSLIKETRFLRRQKPLKKPRKTSGKKPKAKKPTTKAQIAAMTKEQRMKLIEELEGME